MKSEMFIPDPRVQKAPDPGSATLDSHLLHLTKHKMRKPCNEDCDGDDGSGSDDMLLLVIHHLCRHRHPQVGHEAQHPHDVLVLLVRDGAEEGAAVLLLHLGQLFERLDVAAPAVEVLEHVLLNVGQLQQGALLVPQRLKRKKLIMQVADPDPDWIRNPDSIGSVDPDPGGQK